MGTGLEIDGIGKTFGDTRVLSEVGFRVPAGRIVGFVGNNGAGKSTTMRIVLGLTALDEGEVRYDGRAIDVPVRKRIGYMPEERGLYPRMRVLEQLSYLGRLSGHGKTEATAAARRWVERLGLEKLAGARLSELSLGNQQRVQLAAALLHDPRLLILDEPFSGLDPSAVGVMSDVLREQAAQGRPVLFSSHQLDLVERLCDQVVIISDGRIVADGTVAALRDGAPVRHRVVADGLAPGWTHGLPGVRELAWQDGGCLVASEGGQEQQILASAQSMGPVREFTPIRPDLTELYRDVVNSDDADRD
ncbi:ATP-binding cassette domain-containing protein [Streptomyces sp. NBC_00663]|uniref:ABC transporter ATP-binding protein n=1 Tax=Streptomyces sp. NBC_00663 TaxID=2975801 RepID=UPI002E313E36|nr:ATP-binding cassette domain-containing protein [Streptomyces sp. NBC_00663]